MKITRKHAEIFIQLLAVCSGSWILAAILESRGTGSLVTAVWTAGIIVFVLVSLYQTDMPVNARIAVLTGFAVRCVAAFAVASESGWLSSLISLPDQDLFLSVSMEYFQGNFSEQATNYPYLLNALYHIMGADRLAAQFFNILVWYLGIILILKMGHGFYEKCQTWLITFYSLLPWMAVMTSGIYRESLICFFLMISYGYLWQWMISGRGKHIISAMLMAVPAIWLHAGNIAMWGAILIVFSFWSPKAGSWRKVTWRSFLPLIGIILIVPFYNLVFSRVLGGYFPGEFSFLDFFNRPRDIGRTDYVPVSARVDDLPSFLFWNIYRMVYFWISPSPGFWSSWKDLLFFFCDTVPWAVYFLWAARGVMHHRISQKAVSAMAVCFCFTFIYGWGTVNAGTAMRHRDGLTGIFVMAGMAGLEGRNERDCTG